MKKDKAQMEKIQAMLDKKKNKQQAFAGGKKQKGSNSQAPGKTSEHVKKITTPGSARGR